MPTSESVVIIVRKPSAVLRFYTLKGMPIFFARKVSRSGHSNKQVVKCRSLSVDCRQSLGLNCIPNLLWHVRDQIESLNSNGRCVLC
jgi:hypothetical protein